MTRPHLLIGSTLRSVRHEILLRDVNQNSPLVLVPGHAARRGWRKVAQKYFPDGCVLPRFAVIDKWFIEAALASANIPLQFITPVQRRLVLRSLLASLKPQLQRDELKNLVDSNSFLQQIDRWMAHLFEANVQKWPNDGGPWSHDLKIILQNYDSWKQRQSGAQIKDAEVAPKVFAEFATAYPNLPREIILEAAISPTPNQCEGFKSLISCCDSFTATLVVPGIDQNHQTWPQFLEYVMGSVLEDVVKFWQEQDADLEIIESENPAKVEKLTDLRALANSRSKSQKMYISSAHTLRQELRQVATSIRDDSKTVSDAARSTVILNKPSRYQDVLKSTFGEYGLPVRHLPKQSLLASPLVQKWMQLLNLPRNHWTVSELVDVFAGNSLMFRYEDHLFDVRRIEKMAALLRVFRLNNLEEIFGLLEKSPLPHGLDADETKKELATLIQLQHRVTTIGEAKSRGEWLTLLKQLLVDVTAHWKAEESENARVAKLQIDKMDAALKKLKDNSTFLDTSSQENVEIWQSQLNLLLADSGSAGEIGVTCGVDITSPRLLLQDVPDVIYWAGMLESDYPTFSKDALQMRHQSAMNKLCPHLPTSSKESVYWLALALVESDEVHFSWPKYCDGRSVSRSVLLEELMEGTESGAVVETPKPAKQKETVYYSNPRWRCDLGEYVRFNALDHIADKSTFPQTLHQMFEARNSLPLNPFDGSLDKSGTDLMETFLLEKDKSFSHSASSLHTYSQCSLRYFFQKVLSLEDRPGISLMLEKNEYGTLIHKILERFYTQFQRPLNQQNGADAWSLLVLLTQAEAAKLPLSQVLQKAESSRLIGAGGLQPQGVLGKFLNAEIELRESDWDTSVFAHAMQPFGQSSLNLPDGLKAYEGNFNLELDDIKISGKFDRLDVSIDEGAVMVIDYKTGTKLPSSKSAPDGIDFQLPLYLWALDRMFGEQGLKVGGVFYSLKEFAYKAGISKTDVLQKTPNNKNSPRPLNEEDWNRLMETFANQVKSIDDLIKQAQFPISIRPADKAGCEYCEYKNICFRNEQLQTKRREELSDDPNIYTEGLSKSARATGKDDDK